MTYADYLRSDHWGDLRLAAYALYGKQCEVCRETRRIEVHHTRYQPSWFSTSVHDLMVLCRACHKMIHRRFMARASRELILAAFKPTFEHVHGSFKGGTSHSRPARKGTRKAARNQRKRNTDAIAAKWRPLSFADS